MNRKLTTVVRVALVLLIWAALDDITTGNEANYFWEWMIVVAIPIWWLTGKIK